MATALSTALNSAYPFTRLNVDAYFSRLVQDRIAVSWSLSRTYRAAGPYKFTLYRHRTITDDKPLAVAEAIDVASLQDNSPVSGQFELALSYSVGLQDGEGGQYRSQITPIGTFWNHRDWRLAREIVRKETLLLRKKTGSKGWLLKRRWWGDPCLTCTDTITKSVIDPTCTNCAGTGIIGGYYPPTEYWIAMSPTKRLVKLTADQGLITANSEDARCLAYPVVEPNDVWVQSYTGNRYRIQADIASIARIRGIDLVLNVQLDLLPTSAAVYGFATPD